MDEQKHEKTGSRGRFRFFLCALAVLSADQLCKRVIVSSLVLYQSIPLIPDFFHFTYILNSGASFGVFRNGNLLFIGLSALTCVFLCCAALFGKGIDSPSRLLMGAVTGGALGNLLDRLQYGAVVDFLDFRGIWKYVFNVADAALVCAGLGLVFIALLDMHKRKPETAGAVSDKASDADSSYVHGGGAYAFEATGSGAEARAEEDGGANALDATGSGAEARAEEGGGAEALDATGSGEDARAEEGVGAYALDATGAGEDARAEEGGGANALDATDADADARAEEGVGAYALDATDADADARAAEGGGAYALDAMDAGAEARAEEDGGANALDATGSGAEARAEEGGGADFRNGVMPFSLFTEVDDPERLQDSAAKIEGCISSAEQLITEIDYTFITENAAANNRLGAFVGLLACVKLELKGADIRERLDTYREMIDMLQHGVTSAVSRQPETEAFMEKLEAFRPRLTAPLMDGRRDEQADAVLAEAKT